MEYFNDGTFIKNYHGLAIYSKEFQGNLLYCAVKPATYECCSLRESYYMTTVEEVEAWIDNLVINK